MIYPSVHSLLPALLHAVIEKITNEKFIWQYIIVYVEHNSTLTEIWKKKYKKHTTMTWHKLVRKIALNEQLSRKRLCIIYEKLFAAMKFCDSSIRLVILVAITEATKCSHPSPVFVMWKYVNKKMMQVLVNIKYPWVNCAARPLLQSSPMGPWS